MGDLLNELSFASDGCVDFFTYVDGLCIPSTDAKDDLVKDLQTEDLIEDSLRVMHNVSEIACERICQLHTYGCNGILYNRLALLNILHVCVCV